MSSVGKKARDPKTPDFKTLGVEITDAIQREQEGKLTPAERRNLTRMAKDRGQSLPEFLNVMQRLALESAKPKPWLKEAPEVSVSNNRIKTEQKTSSDEKYFRDLVGWANGGDLKKKEIEKLSHAAANGGEGIPAAGRKVLSGHAASRGQTLPQYLRCMLAINDFVRKTGEDDFDHEVMTADELDHYARLPNFVPDVLGAGVVLCKEGKLALLSIIASQESEMRAQANSRGNWPREAALDVAKVWITHFVTTIVHGEFVFSEKEKGTWPLATSCLLHTHKAAATLIQNALLKSPVQKGQVARACAWLREKRENPLAYPPWDAAVGVHEGLELLKDALGLHGPSPVMSAEVSAPASNQPKSRSSEEALLGGQPAPLAAVGKMAVIEWNKCLRYDGEVFNIQGVERWRDIRTLLDARGEYVKLEKGFPQRFAQGGARRFRMIATEAEGAGRKGTGRYKIKQ